MIGRIVRAQLRAYFARALGPECVDGTLALRAVDLAVIEDERRDA